MNLPKMSQPENSSYFCCSSFLRGKYSRSTDYWICGKLLFLILVTNWLVKYFFSEQSCLLGKLISFKDIRRWFISCRAVLYRFNAVKTALQEYSLASIAYRNRRVPLSSIEASYIFLSPSEGKIYLLDYDDSVWLDEHSRCSLWKHSLQGTRGKTCKAVLCRTALYLRIGNNT